MAKLTLQINKQRHEIEVADGTPLLWVIREHLGLTGTKYGCGIGQCGACTVHLNGNPVRSCTVSADSIQEGNEITTIEGLSDNGDHPLQQTWVEVQTPQCGYCQSGQIMQAAALLDKNASPSRAEIIEHMNGNLCRCGTYLRILEAIEMAASGNLISGKANG